MPELHREPRLLRKRLDQLLANRKSGRRDGRETEALAECCFRLALHAATPAKEAIGLLQRAHRLDGTNPRYAYHLARVYFVHGEFDRAATWLQAAARLCPASHRIWTHVSLLQRELDAQYFQNDQFEPQDLRKRGEEVASLIREGVDHFEMRFARFEPRRSQAQGQATDPSRERPGSDGPAEPGAGPARGAPPSRGGDDSAQEGRSASGAGAQLPPARRTLSPGRCRWSGIRDLAGEDLLEGEPSGRTRDQALPELLHAARVAETRPNGPSAFAILAIQWLICGYPVETVLRLRKMFPPRLEAPSLALVDLVCGLWQAGEDRVAARIAEALDAGSIPPVLAALVHHRRLLARPLKLPAVSDYRAARRFLATVRREAPASESARASLETRAADLTRTIEQATSSLRPPPPAPIQDVPPKMKAEELDPQAISAALHGLDGAADALARLFDRAEVLLDQLLGALDAKPLSPETVAKAHADRQAFPRGVKGLRQTAEIASEKLDVLAAGAFRPKGDGAFDALRPELAKRRQTLNALLYGTPFARKLRRIDERLARPAGEPPPVSVDISEGLSRFLDDIAKAVSAESGAGPATPAEQVAALERQIKGIKAQLDEHWKRLVEMTGAHPQGGLSEGELAECAAINEYVASAPTVGKAAFDGLDKLSTAEGTKDDETIRRLDEGKAVYQNIGPRMPRFRTMLNKVLPKPAPSPLLFRGETRTPAAAGPAAQAAGAPPQAVASATPDAPPPPEAPPDPTPQGALEWALRKLDQQIDEGFAKANDSFRAYSPRANALPPIQALRLSVRARQAEILFRLGRRRDARRIWGDLLRVDRLDPRLLKNIAICDSRGADLARTLASWQSYVEMLYFLDTVAGTPRPRARERAELHRHYGNAFAPGFFFEQSKDNELKVDEAALISFLDSPGRVRTFVDHKVLELLNSKLDFRSPPLILGIRRSEGEKAAAEAKEKMLAFAASSGSLLPERIRAAFTATVRSHIEAACEGCASARRLTREKDPHYAREEPRHQQWVKDLCALKHRLFRIITESKELPRRVASIDFLGQFARLDEVPVGQSPSFLGAVARSFGLEEAAVLLEMLHKHLIGRTIIRLAEFIFKEGGDPADNSLRARQYRRLVEAWVKNPVLSESEWLQALDDPQQFYPQEVMDALKTRTTGPQAIETLRQWCERYPECTGPARHLAVLLHEEGKSEEAIAALERAHARGFYEAGRELCAQLLRQLGHVVRQQKTQKLLDGGNFTEALPLLLEQLDADDEQPVLAQNVIALAVKTAEATRSVADLGRIVTAVQAWLSRAQKKLKGQAKSGGDEKAGASLTQDALDEVAKNLNRGLVQAFLAAVGQAGEKPDWSQVAQAMDRLISEYGQIAEAYYYRMCARKSLAEAAMEAGQRDRALSLLRQCLADASVVAKRATDPDQRQQAADLAKKIRGILPQ